MKKSLIANILWNSSYQILVVLMPLITIPYVSRVLGAEQIGVYSFTYSVSYYCYLLAMLGMGKYGTRLIAQAGDDRRERSKRFWSAWACQACVSVAVCVAYMVYALSSPVGGTRIAFIWGLWVVSTSFDVYWLFNGVEEFKAPTIRNFITKILGTATIFLLCKGRDDLWAYVLGIAGSYFANAVLILPFVKRYVDFYRPQWHEVARHFRPNLQLFVPVIAMSLYTVFGKILLAPMSGLRESGYFEYSDKIIRVPLTVVDALCAVMLPHMTAKIAENKTREAIDLLEDSFWYIMAVAIGVAFGISTVTPEFVPVFFGDGFDACKRVMPITAVALPLIAASDVIGVQYLLPNNRDKDYTRSVWAGAIVNVTACIALIPRWGAVGAGMATVLSEAVVLLYQCAKTINSIPLRKYLCAILPFIGFGVVMMLVVRALAKSLALTLGIGWTLLAIEVVVSIAVYGCISLAWCVRTGRLCKLKELLATAKDKK